MVRLPYRVFSLVLGLALLPLMDWAQVSVQTGLTPEEIVQDHLIGEGLRTRNIKYTGHPDAIGVFAIEGDRIGFSGGLIISTGKAADAAGPNDNPKTSTALGRGGDKKFYNIAGTRTFDASVLEFDLMPARDSLVLNFIFASEEYNDYVGSTFSDAFIIRLSGPGYPNGKDLGVIPGTQTHINVNSVNYNTNGKYYRDNNPYTLAGRLNEKRKAELNPEVLDGIEFDGMTHVIRVGAKVKPREKYHIEIGIADAGDGQMDSALLVEGESLSSVEQYRWVLRRQKIAEKRRQDSLARVAFVEDSLAQVAAREQAIADSLAALEAEAAEQARMEEAEEEGAEEGSWKVEKAGTMTAEDDWETTESESEEGEHADGGYTEEDDTGYMEAEAEEEVEAPDPYFRAPGPEDSEEYKGVIRFPRDEYLLSTDAESLLRDVGKFAAENPGMRIGLFVPGNDETANLRYDMVRLELLKSGISPERIFKNGFSFLSVAESGGRHRAEIWMRKAE
jgi:hypothetical protein